MRMGIKKNIRYCKNYWLVYSFVFALFIGLCLHWVWLGQSSLNSQGDDFRQHYNALLYIGRWYRQIVKNVLVNRKLEIPLYEWNLGYGSDIITTFSYYGIADPFYVLSAIVPAIYIEYLFWILIVLRSYCMGIFFSMYCLYKGNSKFSTLVGSILYVCCGFNLGPAFHQIIFQSGLIWVPLIFLGIEKIFKENKIGLYVISTVMLICSSIYFYYMTVFAVIIYCMTYVLSHHYSLKRAGKYVLMFLIISIISLLLTAFITLPVVLSLVSNDRAVFAYSIPILYDMNYYLRLPALMFSLGDINSLYLGFSPIAVMALVLLFIKQKDKSLRMLSAISVIFILIPWFGHFFNGNSFVCNRWSFLLAFLIAYITVRMVPECLNVTEKEYKKLIYLWTVYFVYCLLIKENRNIVVMTALALGYLFIVTVLFGPRINIFIKKLFIVLWIYLGIFNIIEGGISSTSRIKLGTAFEEMTVKNPVRLLKCINDREYWRTDQSSDALKRYNQSLYLGVPSTEYYWSMSTPSVLQFFRDVESSNNIGAMASGVDNRQYLENFLGVKYYLTRTGGGGPYGFQEFICEGQVDGIDYSIYKNIYRGNLIRFFSSRLPEMNIFCFQ